VGRSPPEKGIGGAYEQIFLFFFLYKRERERERERERDSGESAE
jgi:hypothetical protein